MKESTTINPDLVSSANNLLESMINDGKIESPLLPPFGFLRLVIADEVEGAIATIDVPEHLKRFISQKVFLVYSA